MGKSPAQEMKKGLVKTKEKIKKETKGLKDTYDKDKTFGLKDKSRSAKVQHNADQLRAAAAKAGRSKEQIAADDIKKEKQRVECEIRRQKKANGGLTDEELLLGKTVVKKGMDYDPNVDPKTIVCGFYKAGKCKKKGNKCKFSHDLGLEVKTKINLYHDPRETDTMDLWDQDKLEMVVKQKDKFRPNATKIVCKFFIDAIEDKKYGWFWKCENGDACIYQHKLPAGFVLKCDMVETETVAKIDLAEQIDLQRSKLDVSQCTPVTPETFKVWREIQKKKRTQERIAREEEQAKANKKGKAKTNNEHGMSGRDLFTYDPSMFVDDEDAGGVEEYEEEEEAEEEGEEGEEKTPETETKNWDLPESDTATVEKAVSTLAVSE